MAVFNPNFCPKSIPNFFNWNHQKLLKLFILHEKFMLSRIYHEKLLKTLKIAIFALNIIYFGSEKVPLWTTAITKTKYVLKILIENFIRFQKLLFFFFFFFFLKFIRFRRVIHVFVYWITGFFSFLQYILLCDS